LRTDGDVQLPDERKGEKRSDQAPVTRAERATISRSLRLMNFLKCRLARIAFLALLFNVTPGLASRERGYSQMQDNRQPQPDRPTDFDPCAGCRDVLLGALPAEMGKDWTVRTHEKYEHGFATILTCALVDPGTSRKVALTSVLLAGGVARPFGAWRETYDAYGVLTPAQVAAFQKMEPPRPDKPRAVKPTGLYVSSARHWEMLLAGRRADPGVPFATVLSAPGQMLWVVQRTRSGDGDDFLSAEIQEVFRIHGTTVSTIGAFPDERWSDAWESFTCDHTFRLDPQGRLEMQVEVVDNMRKSDGKRPVERVKETTVYRWDGEYLAPVSTQTDRTPR
jgi:hypothetical protein